MRNIIAIDIKDNRLSDSLGRSLIADNSEKLLEFLMFADIDLTNSFIVCWNLYQLLGVIRRCIPENACLELLEKDKVWVNGYKLFSVSGTQLSIGHEYKTHTSGNFYDSVKREVDIFNLYKYFPKYQPTDINDIVARGIEFLTALESIGLNNTTTLASGIAIYNNTVLEDTFIPHLYDCPEEAIDMADYALELLTREWRATYKIGRFTPAYHIDINGCYPSLVRNFGDLSNAKFWYGKKYQPCDFGIFKGQVTITGDTPIVNTDKQPVIGTYQDMITTDQWAYLNRTKKGHFLPIDGWMLKYQNDYKPFYDIMTNLYNQREREGLTSDLFKSILVGLIGQLAQDYGDKKGKHYNPIYSVMATSRASLKLGMKLDELALWDNLISVIVDGALVDTQISLGNGKRELGDFRSESIDALVLSIGHKYIKDNYADMIQAIQAYPKAHSYNDVILVPEWNTSNRVFEDYPQTGHDWITKVYKSKAIETNLPEGK